MHYVIGDIHNENAKLQHMLRKISFGKGDHLYILGDLFDRGFDSADPVGVYFTVLGLEDRCSVIRGNHDQWLAEYIEEYYSLPEKARDRQEPYFYNSFDLMRQRLAPVDLQNLAEYIKALPLQLEVELDRKYLLAHAMTSPYGICRGDMYYLMGDINYERFIRTGIRGYISFCGHEETGHFVDVPGRYFDEKYTSIWVNQAENVYMMDCGCGFRGGRLGCFCLETGERYYV